MKALPAFDFTLKHNTAPSFVKGLAAYCEQNNIGPLVIENDVELQVKVWTGDAFDSPYQTGADESFNPRRANYTLL